LEPNTIQLRTAAIKTNGNSTAHFSCSPQPAARSPQPAAESFAGVTFRIEDGLGLDQIWLNNTKSCNS